MLHRAVESQIEKILKAGKSILLLGPRQTGKTTLLQAMPGATYLSLAKASLRLQYQKDPTRLERELGVMERKREVQPLVIIDEIQKIPELMDSVQDLVDNRMAQFILTGSSARKLKKTDKLNLLPGRVIHLRMDPLMNSEYPNRTLEDHLLYGDLPEIALTKDPEMRERLLHSYVEAYLDEEVKAEALVRNIGPFSRFLELASIESGKIANFSAFSKDLGPSVHTISSYFEVLVDCLVAERVEPITRSTTRKKLTRSPRFLIFDLGVRRAAANEGTRLIPERMGELFEQWVGLELIRLLRTLPAPGHLRFWRDPDGPEVDWVVEIDGKWIPIEVKWSDSPRPEHARHLDVFIKEYKNSAPGFVVCRAHRPQRLSEQVTAIPWQELSTILSGHL